MGGVVGVYVEQKRYDIMILYTFLCSSLIKMILHLECVNEATEQESSAKYVKYRTQEKHNFLTILLLYLGH